MSHSLGNPPFPLERPSSGFQEPGSAGLERFKLGVLGTAWGRDRDCSPDSHGGPSVSGYWEPPASVEQEPRITGYSGPAFVVTGTDSRGFRNRTFEKRQSFQVLRRLSTALNALTSFSNRISLNAAEAETSGKTPPLGGFAPAGSLRRYAATPRALARPPHPASPNRRRAPPDKLCLGSRVPMILDLENCRVRRQRRKGLSGESLAFSAENPRNRRWVASTSQGGELR